MHHILDLCFMIVLSHLSSVQYFHRSQKSRLEQNASARAAAMAHLSVDLARHMLPLQMNESGSSLVANGLPMASPSISRASSRAAWSNLGWRRSASIAAGGLIHLRSMHHYLDVC
jgi:hypothetical protein